MKTKPQQTPNADKPSGTPRPRPQVRPDPEIFQEERRPPTIYGEEFEGVLRPIVFVPGILGSEIKVKGEPRVLWPPYKVVDGDFKYLDKIRDLYRTGEKERTAIGPVPTAYSIILDVLRNLRGERNFFPFWYDWTRSNLKSGQDLARHIRRVLGRPEYKGKYDQVDLVCHSMGGIVTRSAGIHGQAAGLIRKAAYLACPFHGAPKAYFFVHPDTEVPIYGSLVSSFIGELVWDFMIKGPDDEDDLDDAIRDLASNMDSVFELLPDRQYLNRNVLVTDEWPAQDFPIRGLEATYYTGDWQFPPGSDARARTVRAMKFKDSLNQPLPGTEHFVAYSGARPTLDCVTFDHVPPLTGFEPAGMTSPANGDGTVPTASSTMNGTAPNQFPVNAEHVALPNDPAVTQPLTLFLQN